MRKELKLNQAPPNDKEIEIAILGAIFFMIYISVLIISIRMTTGQFLLSSKKWLRMGRPLIFYL
ncbi:hypothetical protein O2778_08085 [Ancylomarina euxinus]|nr:hypothetical protein [Ancylomarina euxinus]MCZ4694641.1 hypothetical protein [Ancylomarina euxinus]MUP14186.1 hypothetical protein [Ancylomarina euxinus]